MTAALSDTHAMHRRLGASRSGGFIDFAGPRNIARLSVEAGVMSTAMSSLAVEQRAKATRQQKAAATNRKASDAAAMTELEARTRDRTRVDAERAAAKKSMEAKAATELVSACVTSLCAPISHRGARGEWQCIYPAILSRPQEAALQSKQAAAEVRRAEQSKQKSGEARRRTAASKRAAAEREKESEIAEASRAELEADAEARHTAAAARRLEAESTRMGRCGALSSHSAATFSRYT